MNSIKQTALIICRDLRKRQTQAEEIFWDHVRNKNILGYKFLRQHPLYFEYYGKEKFFIADFFCGELKLVIEIDGGIHEEQKDYDKVRTEILESQHEYKIVRYKNKEVTNDIKRVLINLKSVIAGIKKDT